MPHLSLLILMNKNHFYLKQIFLGVMEINMNISKNLEILHADLQVVKTKKLFKQLWKYLLLVNLKKTSYLIK